MKITTTILIFCLIQATAIGQNIRVYAINKTGAKGQLIRTEKHQNEQLVEQKQYNEKGELAYIISKTYNTQNLLIKEVKRFKIGHEYDLITEYDYDSEGRKINKLSGNNRTGKWSSEGYDYNANGDLATIYFYQKNGDLTNSRIFEYSYDSTGQKTKVVRTDMDLEMEEEMNRSTTFYEYKVEGFDIKMIEKDENGLVIFTEWRTDNTANQPKIIEYKLPDFPKSKTIYHYNKNEKCSKEVAYENGIITMTTNFKYDSKSRIIEKKYKTQNNYGGEIYVY
jgi:hypothetical protein